MCNRFSPGANFDAMNKLALEKLQRLAGELAAGDVRIMLVQWLQDKLRVATTNAVYGPRNPFTDRKV